MFYTKCATGLACDELVYHLGEERGGEGSRCNKSKLQKASVCLSHEASFTFYQYLLSHDHL